MYQTEGAKESQVESSRCWSKAKIDSLLKDLVYETESVTKVKNEDQLETSLRKKKMREGKEDIIIVVG